MHPYELRFVGANIVRPQGLCGSRTLSGSMTSLDPYTVGGEFRIRPRSVEDAALYKNCHPFIEVRIL